MSRYVQFITPENIEVSYELAGIGSRFLAAVIDLLIQVGIVAAILLLTMLGAAISFGALLRASVPGWFAAIGMLASFFAIFGYHAAFEALWRGQTPGKKVTNLRAVRDGGYPLDVYSAVVRNLVRIVDFLPPPYGIGLVSIFFNRDYKRLGDIAAGTIVIKERPPARLGERGKGPASPMVSYFLPQIKSVDAVTAEEFRTIRRFVERRHELEIPIQAHIAMRLAIPLMQKLGLDLQIPVQWHYADLLEAIERRYIEDRGVL